MPGKRGRMNGEGSVYYRPSDDRWCASLTLANGKRKVLYGKDAEDVRRKLAKAVRERDQGIIAQSDERMSVATYLNDWLARKTKLRASSHRRYSQQVAHINNAVGKVRLAKLTPTQIERMYAQLEASGLSSASVWHLHVVLNGAMKDAVKKRILSFNPCTAVETPSAATEEIHPLDERQANAFLTAARGEHQEALFILALRTGMRRGELCALHWKDIDMERGTLLVRQSVRRRQGGGFDFTPPKTKAGRRTIALKPTVIDVLKAHRLRQNKHRLGLGDVWQDNGLVFTSDIGTPQDPDSLSKTIFKRVLRRAGLPEGTRFHDLRHTCATLLLSHGVDAKTVSSLLGHSTIVTTLNTYGHVMPNMREHAADTMEAILAPSTAV